MNQLLAKFANKIQSAALTVIGELRDVVKEYGSIAIAKSGYSYRLISADGQEQTIVTFSKAISNELKAGNITEAQLGYCSVVAGKNAAGEDRLYLTLPLDYRGVESVAAFQERVAKAQRPKLSFDAARAIKAF